MFGAYDPLNYLMIEPGHPYKGAPFFLMRGYGMG